MIDLGSEFGLYEFTKLEPMYGKQRLISVVKAGKIRD